MSKDLFMRARELENSEQQVTATPMDIIKYVGLTKDSIENFAIAIIEQAMEGKANPLDLKLQVKAMEQAIEMIQKGRVNKDGTVLYKGIDSLALSEAEKHIQKGGDNSYKGVSLKKSETGVKYNYENCGDIDWEQIDASERSIKDAKKDRETFLKAIKDKIELVNVSTGETYTVFPPIKTSTTSLIVSFK